MNPWRKPNARAAAIVALATSLAAALLTAIPAGADVAATKHNLSASGPGARKATGESEVCLFCHGPHNTSPGNQLWNRRLPSTSYTPYSSSTTKSMPGQPNGASLMCLSCHDGTTALGDVLTRAKGIGMAGGALSGEALVGTNLSDDHPVSFVYDSGLRAARGELADPTTLGRPGNVRLDGANRMQCTSCHDPHDDTNGKFLVAPNNASALCVTCHQKNGWASSAHRTSGRTWNGAGPNPWPRTTGKTVADNACESCHRPHTAGGVRGLLNHASEEANCYACHNGNVASKNIQAEFGKAFAHDVGNSTGLHDAAETEPVSISHVECVDCHNPHASSAMAASLPGGNATPTLGGALAGARGMSINGAATSTATTEYEVCLRCHSDVSSGKAATSRTRRQIVQSDKRLKFQTGNPSFHPVAGAGRSSSVPSLIAPWTTSSRVRCSDCHNNDASPFSVGTGTTRTRTGPNGPHASSYPSLLERQYLTGDNASESAATYALCYKCHSRANILADQPGSFPKHKKHIVDDRTSCNVCHDPHGISSTQGNSANNARLMNFDTTIVAPTGGKLRWERVGANGGRCYLVCHGKDHNPLSY